MGVFDFVKEAGAKIGIGESQDEKDAKAAAASAERAAEMAKRIKARKAEVANQDRQERREQLAETRRARGLETYVTKLGFEIEDLDIRFDDGLATIEGKVSDQETREKIILAVGNVSGVETVQDSIEVSDTGAEAELHVVESGDTLSKLAKEYYGDAMKYPVIFEANRPMLKDPDLIYVGQVLRIPPAE